MPYAVALGELRSGGFKHGLEFATYGAHDAKSREWEWEF